MVDLDELEEEATNPKCWFSGGGYKYVEVLPEDLLELVQEARAARAFADFTLPFAYRRAVIIPSIPFGPRVSPQDADADYYREAARNIRFQAARGNAFAGSNLTEAVARLCDAVAEALKPSNSGSES